MVRLVTGVSVIMPARNAAATIGRALRCLVAQELEGDYEVVVVDDGSGDATADIAEACDGPVTTLRQTALGPAAARNLGASRARHPLLAFTDADCYATPGWLAAGTSCMDGAELVQGRVVPEPGVALGPFDRSLWIQRNVGLWETANLFVTRDAFERVGGFEDWLTPRAGKAMAEDVWLGWRLRRAGARAAFCPAALVHHAVFRRRAAEYVQERRRLEHFPEIVARMPELRGSLCFRRVFLSRRSAAFDAALVGLGLAAARRSGVPLVAGLPYLLLAGARARMYGAAAPKVGAVDLVADAVGLVALARGSVYARTPLL